MITASYAQQFANRTAIRQRLLKQKHLNSSYKIIDIGGSAFSWTGDIADVIVDLNSTRQEDFCFNISNWWEWQPLLDHVNSQGKFDYAICTHTLEDLRDPCVTLHYLPQIAVQGVITVPTVEVEMSRIENLQWLGYIHHRYMFDFVDGSIVIAPKLEFLGGLISKQPHKVDRYNEIVFEWNRSISYTPFMNDYLGPDAATVVQRYRDWIESAVKKCQSASFG